MSTTSIEEVVCPQCQTRQSILAVESANIQRFPEFRTRLMNGTFMRFECTECGTSFVVEADMLYTDYEQRVFIGIFPRDRRTHVEECETALESTYQQVFVQEAPAFARLAVGGDLQRRVVFGYEELREKVVCFANGLDDHIVEVVKLALVDSDPELGKLSLQQCDADYLWFARVNTMDPPFAVHRSFYDEMHADSQRLQLVLQPLWGGCYVSADKCAA